MILMLAACIHTKTVEEEGSGGSSALDSGWGGGGETGEVEEEDLSEINPDELPEGDSPCREPVLVTVRWTYDGDTMLVDHDNGDSEEIRFIGVDTPEISHEGSVAECYGDEASAYTQGWLEGKPVWLTFDAECTDVYDRTLAYVHTGTGDSGFFERRLLRAGYATTLTIPPNDSYASLFAEDEAAARDAGTGLWSACR